MVGAGEIAPGSVLHADVCVIGAGAAGLTLARELDRERVDTIVLEAGGTRRDVDEEAEAFALDVIGEPQRNPIESRGRWFGGSTNLWFGRIALPAPIDFERRSWVPNSGWPITLDALSPWLDVATRILDVRHPDKLAVDAWPPSPTIGAFRGPHTDLEVFLWSRAMDMGRHAQPLLAASRCVRVVTGATTTAFVTEGALVQAVTVRRADGSTFRVEAQRFVLAGGGIENPRLLLASPGRSGRGVGNEHDNVGRYYLDHPRGEGLAHVDLRGLDQAALGCLADLDERADSPFGQVQFRMVFSAETQRREELLNSALHGHLVTDAHGSPGFAAYKRLRERVRQRSRRDPADLGRDLLALGRGAPQLSGLALARLLRRPPTYSRFVVIDQLEQEPDRDSRVTVDPRQLDRFGLPRVVLDWRIGDSTRRSHRRMHELFRERLANLGIRTLHSELLDGAGDEYDLWDMKHPSGTTRMSASPSDGVVDRDCRVHGVPNLYVAGSSVFPTSGHFNPTLLIVALAARLADHLSSKPGGAIATTPSG